MHEVLVKRLGGVSLSRKSVVKLTGRPDMTLDVYRGRKTATQQHCHSGIHKKCEPGVKRIFMHFQYIATTWPRQNLTWQIENINQSVLRGIDNFLWHITKM